jgi:hypothetical protein
LWLLVFHLILAIETYQTLTKEVRRRPVSASLHQAATIEQHFKFGFDLNDTGLKVSFSWTL